MNLLVAIADFQLPEWLTVGTLGTVLASFVTMIVSLIRTSVTNKINKAATEGTTGILGNIVDKLAETKNTTLEVIDKVKQALTKIDDALANFKDSINNQANSNMNLAKFVCECFNQSNLSDEKKSKLQLMCDQIFYTDNTTLIESLRSAKQQLEQQLYENQKQMAELNAELETERAKLEEQQAPVKKSRRIQ